MTPAIIITINEVAIHHIYSPTGTEIFELTSVIGENTIYTPNIEISRKAAKINLYFHGFMV
jgi:hypothetical protein